MHRDLTPNNIVLGDFGEVYMLDWGIAKLLDESELTRTGPPSARPGSHMHATSAGWVSTKSTVTS